MAEGYQNNDINNLLYITNLGTFQTIENFHTGLDAFLTSKVTQTETPKLVSILARLEFLSGTLFFIIEVGSDINYYGGLGFNLNGKGYAIARRPDGNFYLNALN